MTTNPDNSENSSSFEQQVLSQLGQLSTGVIGLSTQFDKISARVDTLSTQVDTLSTRVDTLSTQVDTLSTRVDTLSTRVDTLSTDVEEVSKGFFKLDNEQERFNDRFNDYQRATQWVVQLAFTLIASATLTVIVTSVLRR
ncbi:MAG: hypothetical protein SNJ57_10150 [Cyanobacteriota bacterium]